MDWHCLAFNCDNCGKQATILEIAGNADGEIVLAGICVLCGRELSLKFSMAKLIATRAVLDSKPKNQYEAMLANFDPKGVIN